MIDWSKCPDVESVPDRCGGAWVVKGSRVMVECILDNAEDCTLFSDIGQALANLGPPNDP